MSSDCPPTIIGRSPAESLTEVTLTKLVNNGNVNEQCLELLPNYSSASCILKKSPPGNVSNDGSQGDQRLSKLKTGDLVYIVTFVDVHHIYVRNVEDDNTAFKNLTRSIHFHCLAAKPIRYTPNLNEIVGAKYSTDGLYYRARILKQISSFRYSVHFIDYGYKENVYSSNIVSLPKKYTEIPSKISMVKLKNIQLCKLNKDARAYVDVISDHETITIDYIQEDTNHVILKTSNNQNINSHLNSLIFGKNNNIKTNLNDKSEENSEIAGSASVLKTRKIPASPDHDVVHGPSDLVTVLMKEAQVAMEHDVCGSGESASVSMTKVVAVSEHDIVHRLVQTLSVGTKTESPVPPVMSSVGTMLELPVPPATSSVGTMTEFPALPFACSVGTITESLAPLVTTSVGTMTEPLIPPGTSRWKRFKKSFRRFARRCFFR